MSKEKRRVPKLRFPGFTEDWEQRKADYIFKSVTDKGYPELPVLSASQELGMVYRDQNGIDIQHDKKNEASYKRVLPGQFVIHLRSFQGGFAYSEIEGITSPAYTVINFKNSNEQYGLFWKHVFKSETFIKRLETITYGIRDGRSISFSDFKSLILWYPSFSEQKLIGDSLAVVEKGITLHQRKLEHLNLKKKALLQKLFPKNGERYPELRFPGFTDAWEQRKLGDIVDFLDGQRKPLKESERIKGKYPYYGASGIIDYINDYLFDETLVLLSEDGANIIDRNYPVCFIATGKYWVNNHAHVLKVKSGIIDKFICESLERLDYTKFNTGTAQPKLNQDICQKIIISIPNEAEQKCISEFLDRINNIITLHQRKLEHLQLQKKALLQQMFV
ncbi:restriction endonuclease subunit S [Veillonella atypica]|nr:restriction endonuclease subunit S [Veillonella atypica]